MSTLSLGFSEFPENRDSTRYLYTHVYSCIIHNNQKVKQPKSPSTDKMDKQNVVYSHDGILFSYKKEWNSHPCYNMNKPRKHQALLNKSDTKGQLLYKST